MRKLERGSRKGIGRGKEGERGWVNEEAGKGRKGKRKK
jgi:hypothetical protein